MENQVLSIKGMTCVACAQRIEKAVRKLPGIAQANINLASEKLFVEYDTSNLTLPEIKEAVLKIGYEVVEKNDTKNITIPIGGMTCAACAPESEKQSINLRRKECDCKHCYREATIAYEHR